MPTPEQRARYIDFQKKLIKEKTNHVVRMVKEERFEIEDNAKEYSYAFINDGDIDTGVAVAMATRKKIHQISYDMLKKIRNYEDDIDTTRLKRLINIHINQMKKLKVEACESNIKFYRDMYEAIESNLSWLKILNRY
jgi:pyrimidine operon attenuation protein/uracil phosphoribosyltransferase